MFEHIKNYCKKNHLIIHGDTIIVGLSGGADSVFLLHFLHHIAPDYNLTLIAAHLNHGWRENAHEDEQLCEKLCESLQIPLIIECASSISDAVKDTGSLEDMGRRLRRAFFERVRAEHNGTSIALAHHFDDQIETFFIRLARGASVDGLSCMLPRASYYTRPLLEIKKEQIITWLFEHHISYVEDYTNKDPRFLRNRIRHTIIPALNNCDSRFEHNIMRTIEQMQITSTYLHEQAHAQLTTMLTSDKKLMLKPFLATHEPVTYYILLEWLIDAHVPFTPSRALYDEIIRFLSQQSEHRREHHFNGWYITRTPQHASCTIVDSE